MRAPQEEVWAVLTELRGWTYWAGLGEVKLERAGSEETNGVGAIRAIAAPGLTVREQITVFEAPERFQYTLLSGLPVRSYLGEVLLESRPHGTVLRWNVSYSPRFPGTARATRVAIELGLKYILSRLDNRMAPLAEHRSECPYADAPDGRLPGLRLRGRAMVRRALLEARKY